MAWASSRLRRRGLTIAAAFAGSVFPRLADAHGGLSGDAEVGAVIWWLYGILIAVVVGFVARRIFRGRDVEPEKTVLKHRLADLERSLKSCMTQLRNASDYPNECGLTEAERQDRMDSAAKIQRLIEDMKSEIAAA